MYQPVYETHENKSMDLLILTRKPYLVVINKKNKNVKLWILPFQWIVDKYLDLA